MIIAALKISQIWCRMPEWIMWSKKQHIMDSAENVWKGLFSVAEKKKQKSYHRSLISEATRLRFWQVKTVSKEENRLSISLPRTWAEKNSWTIFLPWIYLMRGSTFRKSIRSLCSDQPNHRLYLFSSLAEACENVKEKSMWLFLILSEITWITLWYRSLCPVTEVTTKILCVAISEKARGLFREVQRFILMRFPENGSMLRLTVPEQMIWNCFGNRINLWKINLEEFHPFWNSKSMVRLM